MWDWIVNILFQILKLIQSFAVDWGLSIIILVIIVRLLLTPLMLKSSKSTARMQVLQPKLQELQERYADDPQRQAEEMQKFYSENKFNPFGSCLPLLIQMPILFALFTLLNNLPQYFSGENFSFYGILPDLQASAARRAVSDRACAVRRADAHPAAVDVAQPDRPAGFEHAHDGCRHGRHDAVDRMGPSRRCSSVLRRLLCVAGCSAAVRHPEGYRKG